MKILITGAWFRCEDAFPEIRALGHEIIFMQKETNPLPCPPEQVEGMICNRLFTHYPISAFPNLRYLQILSAGYDHVPMDEVARRSIEFHTAKGVYSIPMAEYAVGGILWLYKRMPFFYDNKKEAKWIKDWSLSELFGKTVLILGCGSIGTACAERLKPFGCSIYGFATKARKHPAYDAIVPLSELNVRLPEADVLISALPLTEETRGVIGAEQLNLMKSNAILVNISRGGILDHDALEHLIDRIGGAVLDVFETEPLPADSPLWSKENVIITPHNSFYGEGNRARLKAVILENLKHFK